MGSALNSSSRVSRRVVWGCLTLAVFGVYWQTRTFLFTNYDDPFFINENPIVRAGLTLGGVLWAFSTSYFDFWHPLTWLSHMAACDLFGPRAGLHHLVNVALHGASTVLLFEALRLMTGAWKRSAVVAALFAVHPLHVESVAWLAERKDALSGFFFMLTLWAYARYVEHQRGGQEANPIGSSTIADNLPVEVRAGDPSSQPSPLPKGRGGSARQSSLGTKTSATAQAQFWYRVAVVSFALGLMSKAMIVTLPFVLLLLDYWPLGRVSLLGKSQSIRAPLPSNDLINTPLQRGVPARPTPGNRFNGFLPLIREKLPFFILAAASCLITYRGMGSGQNVLSAGTVSWGFRLSNALVSYVRYLGKFFWPAHLIPQYSLPASWPFWHIAGSALLLVLLTALALRLLRRAAYIALGWFWFLGMLVPVIGVVAMSYAAIADRYMYLPSIGLSVAVVWAAAEVCRSWRLPSAVRYAVPVIAIAAYGYAAWIQTGYWHDSVSLWRHCLAEAPDNVVAHYNLGWALQHAGQTKQAEGEYLATLKLKPEHLDATMNLGVCYATLKDMSNATNWYAKALQLKPDYWKAQENMGTALVELGDFDNAKSYLEEALKLHPASAHALTGLGRAWSAQGRSDEAFRNFNEAVRIEPNSAEAQYYLGLECLKAGMTDEALRCFRAAILLNPNWPEAQVQFADALLASDSTASAIEHYREALRLDPNLVPALNNLAWLLATRRDSVWRDGVQAVRLGQHACELTHYEQPIYVGTLAAAYAEAGDFDQAVKSANKACELASSLGQTNVFQRNQELLKLYRAGKPCRQ